MRILAAADGGRGGDFAWAHPGEPVSLPWSWPGCTALRAFAGIDSRRAATTAVVADDVRLTVEILASRLPGSFRASGGWPGPAELRPFHRRGGTGEGAASPADRGRPTAEGPGRGGLACSRCRPLRCRHPGGDRPEDGGPAGRPGGARGGKTSEGGQRSPTRSCAGRGTGERPGSAPECPRRPGTAGWPQPPAQDQPGLPASCPCSGTTRGRAVTSMTAGTLRTAVPRRAARAPPDPCPGVTGGFTVLDGRARGALPGQLWPRHCGRARLSRRSPTGGTPGPWRDAEARPVPVSRAGK
jgi:hypothetical protein